MKLLNIVSWWYDATCIYWKNFHPSYNPLAYLQLFISEVFSELLRDSLEILEGDPPGLVIIKQTECFQYLLFRILLGLR